MKHTTPESPKKYEVKDVHARPLISFTIGLTLFTLAVCIFLYFLMAWLESRANSSDRPVFFYRAQETKTSPAVQLEVFPSQTLQEYREEMQELTTTYGWADRQNRIARIPVDEAIEIVLAKGLPSSAKSESEA